MAPSVRRPAQLTPKLTRPMYGLDDEEIEYIKQYDEQYRLSDVEQTQLVDVSFDWEGNEEEGN